jgi:hypothetical protein
MAAHRRRHGRPRDLAPIALRTESPDVLSQLHIRRDVIPAPALGTYLFNPRFTLGCHGPELGTAISPANATDLPAVHAAATTPQATGGSLTCWTDLLRLRRRKPPFAGVPCGAGDFRAHSGNASGSPAIAV